MLPVMSSFSVCLKCSSRGHSDLRKWRPNFRSKVLCRTCLCRSMRIFYPCAQDIVDWSLLLLFTPMWACVSVAGALRCVTPPGPQARKKRIAACNRLVSLNGRYQETSPSSSSIVCMVAAIVMMLMECIQYGVADYSQCCVSHDGHIVRSGLSESTNAVYGFSPQHVQFLLYS